MFIKDTLLVVLSDMHTGSSTALFPAGGFRGAGHEDNHVLPNERQKEIHPIWTRLIGEVKAARKGRRMIVVNLGDAIDGFHHGSMQESLFRVQDQCSAHIQLMTDFLKKTGYNKKTGDELYYVQGTEIHVGDTESDMAKELGAVKMRNGKHISDVLQININGREIAFFHHGKDRGSGANEGNSLRNYLRDIRIEREKDGLPPLDAMFSGHTHGHTYVSHIRRLTDGNFHTLHGIICPSFQSKTRYALSVVPMAVNSVGGTYTHIGVDGTFHTPRFVVSVTRDK